MSKLKKTLLFGGLLGAGLIWLTSSKKGKETRDKMLEAAADIYEDIVKELKKMDKKYVSSKSAYTKLVQQKVDKYFEKYPALESVKEMVVKIVLSQWENIKATVEEKVSETKTVTKKAFSKKSKSK